MSAARQLALWVGRKGRGTATLRWDDSVLTLYIESLQIVAVEGDDGGKLEEAFGLRSEGEWFAEAARAVDAGQVTQGEANAVVKRAVADRLASFLLADDAEASFDSLLPFEPRGLTLSYPHLVVEMVLGTGGDAYVPVFVPSADLILHRLPEFARRVGALGLTDQALAVFAKINDARTAAEIAGPSPHGEDLVLRLVAAAVGGGLVDAAAPLPEVTISQDDGVVQPAAPPVPEPPVRRRGLRRAAVVLLVLAAAVVLLLMARPWTWRAEAGTGGPWAVAVDGGCDPAEVERLYRRQEEDRSNYQVVPFGAGDDRCYRLAWGHYRSREAAEAAMAQLPAGTVGRGFVPHVVRVDREAP